MQQRFIPRRAFFEPAALEFPLGRQIRDHLESMQVDIRLTGSHNRVTGIPGNTTQEKYREAKRTLVVGVRKSLDFAACKPSAHYQLPLNTSCPGMCEYCYLATTLGKKPYVRVYVNIEDILRKAGDYITQRVPEITLFEGAATSDPIPTEYLTGLLGSTIEFFGRQKYGRFRFVTKFCDVDSLLALSHQGHTRFRFSLNAEAVVNRYEHATPSVIERVEAAAKVAAAGYPIGFIIAPIIMMDHWQEEYTALMQLLAATLPDNAARDITFEFITHRFTKRAKNQILDLFPQTGLPMQEEERAYKFGQFGYGKYVYRKEAMDSVKEFMNRLMQRYFPQAYVEYLV